MAVLDATGDDSAVASFVSLNVCPTRLLNLIPWLALLDMCICLKCFFFRPFFNLSFMQCPWFDFHLWGLRCCRFCASHITLFYTLVNQVGSGKELLDKASDVESCCITATSMSLRVQTVHSLDHIRSLMRNAGFIWRLKGATAAFCGCYSQLYLWQLKRGRTGSISGRLTERRVCVVV